MDHLTAIGNEEAEDLIGGSGIMLNCNFISNSKGAQAIGCVLITCALTAIPQVVAVGSAQAETLKITGMGSLDNQAASEWWSGLLDRIDPYITPAPLPINSISPAAPGEAVGISIPAPSHGQQALTAAESKIGAPYVWGATGPDSFDCSGLAQWAYKQAGVSIPRTTYEQLNAGVSVAPGDLQDGDLVLFYGGDHVGLYAGNGEVVHAPTSGQTVKRAPVDSMPFYAARRY